MNCRSAFVICLLFTVVLTATFPALGASYRVNIRSGSYNMGVTKLWLTHEGYTIWECEDVPVDIPPGHTARLSTGELEMVPNDFAIEYTLNGDAHSYTKYPIELDTWYPLPDGKGIKRTSPEIMVQDEANVVEPDSWGKIKALYR